MIEAASSDTSLRSLAKLNLRQVRVVVSSQQSPAMGPAALLDGDLGTYWHINTVEAGKPAWLVLDLGDEKEFILQGLRITPRAGLEGQLWSQPALLQGSKDGKFLQALAYLSLDHEKVSAQGWATYLLENQQAFRYYRLYIEDRNFISLGELEMYVKAPPLARVSYESASQTAPAQLTKLDLRLARIAVSSQQSPATGPAALLDDDLGTYWHTNAAEAGNPAWLVIDLGEGKEFILQGLRIAPRAGLEGQLWSQPALLQGSSNQKRWQTLASLSLDREKLPVSGRATYLLENQQAFRYYRLYIEDRGFISLGELEVYVKAPPTATPTPEAAPLARISLEVDVKALPTATLTPDAAPVPLVVADDRYRSTLSNLTMVDLSSVSLKASSQVNSSTGAEAISDGDAETFWHIDPAQRGKPVSLDIDLGEKKEKALVGLTVLPRSGFVGQLWTKPAQLQGSVDGKAWQGIVALKIDQGALQSWANFAFANPRAYRYYRLYIEDADFISFSELGLFAERR